MSDAPRTRHTNRLSRRVRSAIDNQLLHHLQHRFPRCQTAYSSIESASRPIKSSVSSYQFSSKLSSTDPLGYSRQQDYNAINQPTLSTNALQQTSSLSYDPAGRVTSVVNPAGISIQSYTPRKPDQEHQQRRPHGYLVTTSCGYFWATGLLRDSC
jgi:YD repeat-containing protein